MILYDYKCEACGWTGEVFVEREARERQVCPECGEPLTRVIYPVGFTFKVPDE